MEIRQKITLSVDRGTMQSYYAKQNDNNTRVLEITLTKNGQPIQIPKSEKATVRYTRADGKGDEADAVVEGNEVIVRLTDEMLALAGTTYLDVALHSGTDILSSSVLSIITGGNPLAAEKITGSSDFLILIETLDRADKSVKDVEALLPKATQAINGANAAKASAETATAVANAAAKRAEDAAGGVITAATATKLGGFRAKPATYEDTQEIHINSEGFPVTKPSSSSENSFDIRVSQIKDSKSIVWIDERYEKRGSISSAGEILENGADRYFSINVEGKSKFVLYSDFDIGIKNIRLYKVDGTFENVVVSNSIKPIPWLNLINLPISSDVKSVEFNAKNHSVDLTGQKIGYANSLLFVLKTLYKGYNVFSNEEGKAIITEQDNIYDPKYAVPKYYTNQNGAISSINNENCSISVIMCEANKTYYVSYGIVNNSASIWVAINEDGVKTPINQTTELEKGFTIIKDGIPRPSRKFTPAEDCALIFTTGLVSGSWISETVVTTVADKENFEIENVITKINGKGIKDLTAQRKKAGFKLGNVLEGKNIAVIGDSITEKNFRAKTNWAGWISKWTGAVIQNLGHSGTGFALQSPYINRIAKINKDTDLICVSLSWNDLVAGKPAGDINDTGTETLSGYANDFFTALIEGFPTTPIICFCQGPWYNNKLGNTASDKWLDALSKVCAKHNVPFYGDLYTKGCALRPWIAANREKYYKSDDVANLGTVDNVHPNSEGHKIIARYIMPKMIQNMVSENADYTIAIEE